MRTRRGGMRYCSFPELGQSESRSAQVFAGSVPSAPRTRTSTAGKSAGCPGGPEEPGRSLSPMALEHLERSGLDRGTFLTTVRGRRFVATTVGARLRHVIIEVSHPSLVEDLLEFLRSSSCEAMRCGGLTVDVRAGWPLGEGGQRHLDLYLAAWEAKNPGARAVRVG